MFCGAQPMPSNPVNLIDVIRLLGLTNGLQLCLDARDVSSYPGSGTKWLDRSGGGYDFFLGTDGTTNAPTFTGTAGMPAAYWAFDGSDVFTYDTTNEAWMTALHQSGATWSALFGYFHSSGSGLNSTLLGDNGGLTSGTGVNVVVNTNGFPGIRVRNAGATVMASATGADSADGAWNFFGFSVDAPAGASGGNSRTNGSTTTFDATYSSPSAGAPTDTMQVAATGGSTLPMINGSRIVYEAVWSVPLSAAQLGLLRQYLRQPLGI